MQRRVQTGEPQSDAQEARPLGRRQFLHRGLAAAGGAALAGTTGGDRFIGVLPRLQLNWRASRHVTVRGELSMVVVSDHIEALGGETAAYANASVAWRY
jgi:hypothetical protein